MNGVRDLLVEVGTEELPPKALKRLSDAFCSEFREGLARSDLAFGEIHCYATPRRLGMLVKGLAEGQPDREVERRGPAVTAAFDEDGVPTKAARGFARSCGVEVDQLETAESDKGAWLIYRSSQQGRPAAELIPALVQSALDRLPIPKRMRWGALTAEFVRPVHWLVLLFGDEVIDCELLGVRSGRETRGHRFHHPEPIYLGEPEAYAPILESEGRVMVDFVTRREAIRAQVLEAAARVGGKAELDGDLLDEVTGLVEWPVAVVGSFEERFLEVPPEALISAMKGHQKYFHMLDEEGRLMPYFVTVSNIESHRPEVVRAGNERVIRPRLTDAEFFWRQDRKGTLASRREQLKSVVFQSRLGTVADKSDRVAALAEWLAAPVGGEAGLARRAGELGKCDLMTEMVGEFPELQGVMGRYYASHDGEPGEVAVALDEQYQPRFAGDALPATPTGQALALAERLDTLVGIFGIGQTPSGDKDPFALRRAALGVLRIAIEQAIELDLPGLLERTASGFKAQGVKLAEDAPGQVYAFMLERLRNYFLDRGLAYDSIDAVLERRPVSPLDADRRLRAVEAFRKLPEAEALAAANKRIHNILRKVEEPIPESVSAEQLQEPAEQALADRIDELTGDLAPLFESGDYEQALTRLASLRAPVDAFFDQVMVMAEDAALRRNRIALLARLQELFLRVADLSRLQG